MVLVYYGTSLPNKIPNPLAPKLRFCDPSELARVKLSHDEYESFLNAIKDLSFVKEVMLISTCNRFEVVVEVKDSEASEAVYLELAEKIAYETNSGFLLAHLVGNEARLQLLRTYCGLNSGLVGEDEICIQFDTAFRQGLAMGYLAESGANFLAEAQSLRKRFNTDVYEEVPSYCDIALRESFKQLELKPAALSKVVIFGSGNTAFKSALSLVDSGVHPENIYVVHRVSCSSTQIESMRENPKLSSVQLIRAKDGYHLPKIRALLNGAELLVFGVDTKHPILELPYDCPITKTFKGQDLKVIDFNSKSSVIMQPGYKRKNYIDNMELDAFVRNYASSRLNDAEFAERINIAEGLLCEHLGLFEKHDDISASLLSA